VHFRNILYAYYGTL